MPKQFYLSILILPNILQLIGQFLLRVIQGHYTQIVFISLLVYTLNFIIISYYLHKWFVKGQGDVRTKTKHKIRQLTMKMSHLQDYLKVSNVWALLKIYCYIISGKIVYQFVPGYIIAIFAPILYDFYHQITNFLAEKNVFYVNNFKQNIKRWVYQLRRRAPRAVPVSYI